MKDAFVTIHGHFYQPPRENPWFEAIEAEESARPFHDWNERIACESYRPNGYARIVDGQGKIFDIINNYASISFNFGPTLLPFLEQRFPRVYGKILEADRESLKRFGHGNAMAQVYNHIIVPLANDRDKETEVLWGIADFEKRFHRSPEAMWLPETAVNYPTLRVLVNHGMQFVILSPYQALRARPLGGKKWTYVSGGRVDPSQPYRCYIRDPGGKKLTDQFINIFFYDGIISKEIAFQDLLGDGNILCDRFKQAYQPSKGRPQLIHIATDGETYGHHKKFGEMALAFALVNGFEARGFEVTNYGTFLGRYPPVYEVEIDEGPKGEGSSWSCAHGVGRWKEDCGCRTGGGPGWNQKWRKPLRESLDLLRDDLIPIFEIEGGKIFKDVWEARNGYVEVVLDRSPAGRERFFEKYGLQGMNEKEKIKGLKLMEMERHALKMYTSCGWFFNDLAGLETVIVLQNAARAMQLADELKGQETGTRFLERLSEAESNLSGMGNGRQVFDRLVRPRIVTPEKVVNHFAITSLFEDGGKEEKIFSYRVEKLNYERAEKGNGLLVLGQVKVFSEIIPEESEFFFGLIRSEEDSFKTWISRNGERIDFETLKIRGFESLTKGKDEMAQTLTSLFGSLTFTTRDTFKEERQTILRRLVEKEREDHCRSYAELFDRTRDAVEALAREGLEIPYEIRMAAEVTLSERLLQEVRDLKRNFKGTAERGEIGRIVEEAKEHGFRLREEEPLRILNDLLMEKMESLLENWGNNPGRQAERVEEIMTLLDLTEKWGFHLSREEAQDVLDEMLDRCVEEMEKCWWGEISGKMVPRNLITLAEKLGFNIDRLAKLIPSLPRSPLGESAEG
jgi:alpha-amylase/alpha-mannosidase (GH57 family)